MIQFIPHERVVVVPVPQFRNKIVGIAKHIPQERVQRIAELIVVCQCHRSWRNRGGDSASGECLHDADCGLVPQIVRASWISSSGMTVPTIFFHEPSMTHSSSSSRARRAGVAGSFTLRWVGTRVTFCRRMLHFRTPSSWTLTSIVVWCGHADCSNLRGHFGSRSWLLVARH